MDRKGGATNIYASKGAKVVFSHPDTGYLHHQETAKEHLTLGKTYTVEETQIDSFHTDVFLQEIPEVAFNSVLFEDN